MSKVLFLVNHEVVIYNFRLELVERLRADGHSVVISCPYGERMEELKALGCEHRDISIARHGMNPVQELKLLMDYIRLLKDVKPDIVLTYTIKPNIYGGMACALLGIPYVANITGLGTAVEKGGMMQKITVLLYKLAFAKIQRVFFQNQENRQFFVDRKIALSAHGMLPGSGVNLQRYVPLPYPEGEKTEFVFISRIMKEKGADQYLDAAEAIRAKHPDTMFHVCGFCEEAYEARMQEMQQRGILVYHGMVKDVKKILAQTHCTIHPTFYPEGISNVLLESCACGRPIITTDRSGCREVIDDGINGFMVKQRDTEDLIEKIEKFLALTHAQREAMGIAGREKVEREYDRQIVVEAYLKEINGV